MRFLLFFGIHVSIGLNMLLIADIWVIQAPFLVFFKQVFLNLVFGNVRAC